MARSIHILQTGDDLAAAAAQRFVRLGDEAVAARGRFMVALTGGRTPNAMYERLGTTFRDEALWPAVQLFWGDERHVPRTHADSNFRAVEAAMLRRLKLPDSQVHRIPAERPNAADAAAAYEQTLRDAFGVSAGDTPAFDLVLLGMGDDGHVASLFPGNAALKERDRLVVAPWVEKLKAYRISLTLPVLNRGAVVMFLVSGATKAEALHAVLDGERDGDPLPAQLIRPAGDLVWMIDRAAAARLETR